MRDAMSSHLLRAVMLMVVTLPLVEPIRSEANPVARRATIPGPTGPSPRASVAPGSSCSVSTTPVAFGSFDPASSVPRDSQGFVRFRCGGNVRSVRIEIGSGGSHNFQRREMINGNWRLAYNLFLDPARHVIWGDGSQGSQIQRASSDPSQTSAVPVYGRIVPGQKVGAGQYADTITVTILF